MVQDAIPCTPRPYSVTATLNFQVTGLRQTNDAFASRHAPLWSAE